MADQNDKLRRLSDHLQKAEWWPTSGIKGIIASLLAEDEPEKTPGDESWRLALSGWLKRHNDGRPSQVNDLADVAAILVRRALEKP